MNSKPKKLKAIVAGVIPAVMVAGATLRADEIQSIAAQVLADQAAKSAQPPAPPAPILMPISGFRS